jgi:hypothetical protein
VANPKIVLVVVAADPKTVWAFADPFDTFNVPAALLSVPITTGFGRRPAASVPEPMFEALVA